MGQGEWVCSLVLISSPRALWASLSIHLPPRLGSLEIELITWMYFSLYLPLTVCGIFSQKSHQGWLMRVLPRSEVMQCWRIASQGPGDFGVITNEQGVLVPKEICQSVLAESQHFSADPVEKKQENSNMKKREQLPKHLGAWNCPQGHYLPPIFLFLTI